MGEDRYFIFEVGKNFDLNEFKELCFKLMDKYKKNIKEILSRQYGKNIHMVSWNYPHPNFKNDEEIKGYIEEEIKLDWFNKDGYTGLIHIPFHRLFHAVGYQSKRYIKKRYGVGENKNYIKIFFGSIAPPYTEEVSFIKEVYSIIQCSGAGSTDYDWYDEEEKDSVNYYDIYRLWSINLFSKEDVKKYGREKLLKAPAEVIEELPDGAIFMMINKDSFSSRGEQREKLRSYLKNDLKEWQKKKAEEESEQTFELIKDDVYSILTKKDLTKKQSKVLSNYLKSKIKKLKNATKNQR